MSAADGERLQKVLARAGLGSRRACDDLIAAGRVTVNGRKAVLGQRVDPDADSIEVDRVVVALTRDLAYLALHKPVGVLSAVRDAIGRETVVDLVPMTPRVFPVGRLDRDTSGLLLLTNDGDFANRVMHPRYEISKTYVAEIRGRMAGSSIAKLRRGVTLEDGPAKADTVKVRAGPGRSLVELTVSEGRNRMVRRLLEAVDAEVLSLVRTAVGPIGLGHLKPGRWRQIRRDEIVALLDSGSGPVD